MLVRREKDLFSDFFNGFFDTTTDLFDIRDKQNIYASILNKEDTKEAITYFIELPGVKKQDLNIEIRNKNLIIEASAKVGNKEIKYSNVFNITQPLETKDIEATLADGVLSLKIIKVTKEKPPIQKIEIK